MPNFAAAYGKSMSKTHATATNHASYQRRSDSLAQLVEHHTFNVGVLGSSPKRVTPERRSYTHRCRSFFAYNKHEKILMTRAD